MTSTPNKSDLIEALGHKGCAFLLYFLLGVQQCLVHDRGNPCLLNKHLTQHYSLTQSILRKEREKSQKSFKNLL